MEADLHRYYGIDYRDRWRRDTRGRRNLTLRMIWVRVRHLPRESATQIHLNGGQIAWGWTEYLLADLWALTARKRHPHRPTPPARKQRDAAIDRERQRRAARKRARTRRARTT
ncbi:hypothetical protein [Tomitella fengzijianii]|uniref:Uncharacterized protein n=1 Tax=Tomitella fengzijianii TaxID=2597660 RepID=A0A516X4K5_9ACTN|nr:hypothetical protein [Tomitella fengzijianii]QDQ97984.1 hypothetical protein FO059_12490 [Tomitella fengzijianii]